ncbi:MAG: hypothetical protein KC912_17315 [Proteobacteria bacterium]|nr:hypothetical protein [Pseudomonadota bacterium]
MSKQRKTGREAGHKSASAQKAPETSTESLVGNRAVADQFSATEVDRKEPGLDTVREVAFPLIERASLALHLEPKPAAEVERFIAILERSHFDRSHKDALIDKVEGDQAAAIAVQDAVERALGTVDDELRSGVIDALDKAWTSLHEGSPGQDSWVHGEATLELSEASLVGPVGDRAGGLIADLVNHLGSDEMKQGLDEKGAGAAIAHFCRSVVLAYHFEEEEEEEFGSLAGPEES